MTVSAALEPAHPSDETAAKQGERRALGVACGAHMLHDGYTDLVWVALPIWQAEFGLSYAAVGLLRTAQRSGARFLRLPEGQNLLTIRFFVIVGKAEFFNPIVPLLPSAAMTLQVPARSRGRCRQTGHLARGA
jgi:hypothetical protein